MLKRFKLLLLLAAALMLCVMPMALAEEPAAEPPAEDGAAEEATQAPASLIPEDYELVCESDTFRLYLKRPTLAIILESKANGAVLRSTAENLEGISSKDWQGFVQSGVVMEYIEDTSRVNGQADFINKASDIVYTMGDHGFTADVTFPEIGISYQVNVELAGSDLKVTIPQDRIVETQEKYTVATFSLFPFLGASYMGEDDGYMLIPDGQGALINLEDNEGRFSQPFEAPVYGAKIGVNDQVYSMYSVGTEPVIMPVFGIARSNDQIGFLGVIEEGDEAARIRAYPNGVRLKYDWVSAVYEYRYVYTQMMGNSAGAGGIDARTETRRNFDIVQHFLLLDGEDATYAGMAVAYRDYLEEKGFFASAEMDDFDVELDMLCLEKENYVLGKQDVVMTSFEDVAVMLSELRDEGVGAMNVVLRGWQEGGLSGAMPTDNYAPAGSLGGSGGLKSLIDRAASRKVPVYLEADFLSMNQETHPVLSYSAFKKITSATWSRPTFGMVYDTLRYVTPSKTLELSQHVVEQMAKNGVEGIALTGITSLMTDYFEDQHYRDSIEMASVYGQVADTARKSMHSRLSGANAYLWPYASSLSDMPVTGSDYVYVDSEVPFLSMALSGKMPVYAEYVNFQANSNRFFLRLVEQGTRPCFLLTMEDPIELSNSNSANVYSSRYELYKQMIVDWYKELSALHEKVAGASIVNHEMDGSLTHVTWSNGVEVYLNFGDAEADVDGVPVPAMDYVVKGGE